MVGSKIYEDIKNTIGSQNRRDVLHVDSAYKERSDVFLTEDRDILRVRNDLEKICGFKIFNTSDSSDRGVMKEYILNILKQKNQRP